jgi:sugar-specific transcriptional regulator TrmB
MFNSGSRMLENEIVKLGLSEKEAKVYLASLELGPSSVQAIAQKSQVNRATTYVVIDSLMSMGLMSTYNEGKKTYFTAESPDRLLEFLKDDENELKKKIDLLKSKLPELLSIASTKADRPTVKYFEGIEGLRTVQNDFVDSLSGGSIIYTFLPYDKFYGGRLVDKVGSVREKRVIKKIKMKTIYTSKEGRQVEYEKRGTKTFSDDVYIPFDKYPFEGGMNVYGDKIFMIDYTGKAGGIVIENKTLAEMMTALFKLAWKTAKDK